MNAVDVVKGVLTAIEQGKFDRLEQLLTDDLEFSGLVPVPLSKRNFIDLIKGVHAGVPNWRFNAGSFKQEGDTVRVPVHTTGKQTRDLPALLPGVPPLPATNKSFTIPAEVIEFRVEGDRTCRIHVDPVPGGGIPGMLHQLGVPVPVA